MRKIKLTIDLADGAPARVMFTNMVSDTEWERIEGRRLSQIETLGLGDSDYCCWAYTLCKLAGDKMPATWREWVAEHPEMTIEVDKSLLAGDNPNPTKAALPAANLLPS